MSNQEQNKRFEIVEPNKDMIELLREVLKQNERILQQNAEVVKAATSPRILFNPLEKE